MNLDEKTPLEFSKEGFINSNYLKQYDLEGQIIILSHLLKNQKWKIIKNKIVFEELTDDSFIEDLVRLEQSKYILIQYRYTQTQIEHCEVIGTIQAINSLKNKINTMTANIKELEKKLSKSNRKE